jgi:hypothetical protein
MFCRYIDCIPLGGQKSHVCCSTGEFLLDMLKVTVTAIVYLATLTYYQVSGHQTYDATEAEFLPVACLSYSTLYIRIQSLPHSERTVYHYRDQPVNYAYGNNCCLL